MVESINLLGSGLNSDDTPLIRNNGDSAYRLDVVYGQDGDFGSMVGIKAASKIAYTIPEINTWANRVCIGSCEYIQNNSFIFMLYGETTVNNAVVKHVAIVEAMTDNTFNLVGYLPSEMLPKYTKDIRIQPYILDKFLGFTDAINEPILINIEAAKLFSRYDPVPYFRDDYVYQTGEVAYLKGYGAYKYVGQNAKITASPWDINSPLVLEKVGNNVNVFGDYHQILTPIPVSNTALIPSVDKPVISAIKKVIPQISGNFWAIRITIDTAAFANFIPVGDINVGILAHDGSEGSFAFLHVATDASVNSISSFCTKLSEAISSAVVMINTELGGEQLISVLNTSNANSCYIDLTNIPENRLALFISNSNMVNPSFTTSGTPSASTPFLHPVTVSFNQTLFSIGSDGNLKKGWNISEVGFPYSLVDPISATYTLT